MSQNKVKVTLSLEDIASPKLREFDQQVDRTGGKLSGLGIKGSLSINGLAGSIASGIIQVQLLNAAFDGLKSLVGGFIDTFNEASKINEAFIVGVGGFMAATGKSYADSEKFLNNFNAKLTQGVSDLPGQTQAYLDLAGAISDNVAGAFKNVDGSINESKINQYLESISTKAGLIGKEDIPSMIKGLNKLLGGKSLAEVANYDVIGTNPALMNALQRQEEQFGEFKDASTELRVEMLDRALNQAVPPEVLAKIKTTAAASIEGFQSRLFDPRTGIFGFMKDLDTGTKGDQSVFNSASDVIKTLIGSGGIVESLGSLLSSVTGITDLTPMKVLRDGLESLNQWLQGINKYIATFNTGINFSGLGSGLSTMWNNLIAQVTNAYKSFDWTSAGEQFGSVVATGFNYLNQFLAGLDWGQVGSMMMQAFVGITQFIGAALGSFAYNFDWTLALVAFGNIFNAGVDAAGSALTVGIDAVISGIGIMFSGIAGWISEQFASMTSTIKGMGSAVIDSASQLFSAITGWFSEIISKIPFVSATQTASVASPKTASRFDGFIPNAANGLMDAAIRESLQMPTGASVVVANSSEAILNGSQQRGLAGALNGILDGFNKATQSQSTYNPGYSFTIQNLVVNSAAMNATDIVSEVVSELDRQFSAYSKSKLSFSEI